jgi:hypothetical protein
VKRTLGKAVNAPRASLGALVVAFAASSCGDQCLVYDYAPPSARLRIVIAATGEPICNNLEYFVSTSRGTPIPHEDTCDWWLPEWTTSADAGASSPESEVVVTVAGYAPETVSFEVTRNECGEIQQPELQQVEVEMEAAP